MALTELQRPDKTRLYNDLQRIANEMYRHLLSWEAASDFINDIETADLDAIGVPTGDIRTDMVDLRQAVDDITAIFNGTAVTPAKSPKDIINKIRKMMPI